MLSIDYTQKLLNLQGVLVKKVTSVHSFTMIDIEMPVTSHVCPHCGTHTSYVHDYRNSLCKRQMIHTFTPSNQNVTIGSGGDANETFTGRVERNH